MFKLKLKFIPSISNEKMKQFYDISKSKNNKQLQDAIYFLNIHETKGNGVL
jgi:hypothetical protein